MTKTLQVAIIGVGLIGGSMGMAIKKNRLAREVIGVCRQHSSLVHALKNKFPIQILVLNHSLKFFNRQFPGRHSAEPIALGANGPDARQMADAARR